MTDRPTPLEQLDGHLAAARIAHEYVSDLHRELVELGAANESARRLLHESAVVTVERMPRLTRRLRDLGTEWAEQELLDPQAAQATALRLEGDLAALMPSIVELRVRQDEIAGELLDRVGRARSSDRTGSG